MIPKLVSVLSLLPLLVACQSSRAVVVDADPALREPLLSVFTSLEGTWEGEASEEGTPVHEFAVTGGGTALREIMFPGSPHEMTNMYTLDGNSVVMTHYCASGNQPLMRARALEGNKLDFRFESVSDLKAADELFMGEMTLVLVDEDTIQQHWRAFGGGEPDHMPVFELHRVR